MKLTSELIDENNSSKKLLSGFMLGDNFTDGFTDRLST